MQAEVESAHLGETELHVAQSPNERPNRVSGTGGLEKSGRHLVEKRSEDVVVVLIH